MKHTAQLLVVKEKHVAEALLVLGPIALIAGK